MITSRWACVALFLVLLVGALAPVGAMPPSSPSARGAEAGLGSTPLSPTEAREQANSWLNYTTSDRSDIVQVAVSPDGSYIAAASDDRTVYVFASSASAPLEPIGTLDLPSGTNATSLALSDLSFTGSPLLLLTYASVAGGATGAEIWNISSSGMFSVAPDWSETAASFDLPQHASPWVRQVAVDQAGSAAILLTGFEVNDIPGANVTFLQPSGTSLAQRYGENFSNDQPLDVAMDTDGSRAIASVVISGSIPAILSFSPNGYLGSWTPPPSDCGGQLFQGAISGDGAFDFLATATGVCVGNAVSLTLTDAVPESVSGLATELSVSYNGSQALFAGGDSVAYFNATSPGWGGAVWKATFPGAVENATLATSQPDYFAVSSQSEVYFFHWFDGLGETPSSAFRTVATIGPVEESALSQQWGVVAIGSGYIVAGGSEFSLVTDAGVPLTEVSISPLSATVGLGAETNFSGALLCDGGPCSGTGSLRWSLTNDLGRIFPATGSTVSFVAGNISGIETLFANGTLGSTRLQSAPVTILVGPQGPPLASVSIAPAPSTLLTEGTLQLTATPVCSLGACSEAVSYAWTLQSSLGSLTTSTGPQVGFLAGHVGGTERVFVNASFGGITVESPPAMVVIQALSSVAISPSSPPQVAEGQGLSLSTAITCSGGPCPAGTTYSWTLSTPSLGTLNTSSGSAVAFTAASSAGSVVLTVNASLGGISRSSSVSITVVAPGPSKSSEPLGLSPTDFYTLIAVVVVLALVGVVLAFRGRSKKRKEGPLSPYSEPAAGPTIPPSSSSTASAPPTPTAPPAEASPAKATSPAPGRGTTPDDDNAPVYMVDEPTKVAPPSSSSAADDTKSSTP